LTRWPFDCAIHGRLFAASMEACGCRFKRDREHYCWLVANPMVADDELCRGGCSGVDASWWCKFVDFSSAMMERYVEALVSWWMKQKWEWNNVAYLFERMRFPGAARSHCATVTVRRWRCWSMISLLPWKRCCSRCMVFALWMHHSANVWKFSFLVAEMKLQVVRMEMLLHFVHVAMVWAPFLLFPLDVLFSGMVAQARLTVVADLGYGFRFVGERWRVEDDEVAVCDWPI